MRGGALLFGLVLALAGCGDDGGASAGMLSVAGRWSGAFQSNTTSLAPFMVEAIINQDTNGNLTATISFADSPCISSANLKGTITGMNLVLAGSDSVGDNITFRGSTNASGTQMSLAYVLNASASGRCETDNGTGTLSK
jgi:hypothetical protein